MTSTDKGASFIEFGESLLLEGMRVISLPKPDIFLCGGPDEKSARHIFLSYLKAKHVDLKERVILVEDLVKGWFRHKGYEDLLSLEQDIADIVAAIVVFVESPGSIAELGSFSCIKKISKKMLVFLKSEHYDTESFIKLGPILHIESQYKNSVFPYPWRDGCPNLSGYLDNVYKNIADFVSRYKTTAFDKKSKGHIMLLIIELLEICGVPRAGEIKDVLLASGVDKELVKDTSKFLFILEKLGHIKHTTIGSSKNTFFYSTCSDKNLLSFAYKKEKKFLDLYKWKWRFRNVYKVYDNDRFNLLTQILQTKTSA